MALSSNTYTGNGSNKLFSIAFPYLDLADIDVYLNGALQTITTQYSFANATTIEFVTAPGAGVKVDIYRSTNNDANQATFFPGSSVRASDLNDNFDQALYTRQEFIENTWNKTDDTLESVETWVSNDDYIGTTGATTNQMDLRHDTLVQTSTPGGSGWRLGKTWVQNDTNKTLSVWDGAQWLGVTSGGTFTTQPTVIYVDSVNGYDLNSDGSVNTGHRIINPKKTIKAAVAYANAGDMIKVAPGVYQESLPIDITVDNLSIVGESQRSCFIHPTVATETQIMFRCNSGTYLDGFTFVGLKASGVRGSNTVDSDPTYGLPSSQGWVAGFYPGCVIRKSPYINNCSNYNDSGVNNAAFDPNNYAGTGGDTSSAPTGGGVIVDGSLPSVSSPLRSFVLNEFTQLCLDGPGLLVCNNGYAQAVSFFGLFCHYHAKALSGGQINMEVGTTDFGRYGLIADGKSSVPIFTSIANGPASSGAVTFAIDAPTAGGTWFGDATRPAINMLVQIGANIYPILSSTPNGAGWFVTISRPNPSNRAENLGLIAGFSGGTAVSFYLRSMISTASHTMEYAGSGCDYTALPENGGVADETKESINLNNGKVWLTSTDQGGKFKVGDTFNVDQQTGFVTIDPQAVATNVISDLTPELGGNLDVLTRNIYSSLGRVIVGGITVGRGPGEIVTNTALGKDTLFSNVTGNNNTVVGQTSLYSNTTGNNNIVIGSGAGYNLTDGSNNTIIGNIAGTAGQSDTIIIGSGSTERMRFSSSGKLGIGTTLPSLGGGNAAAILKGNLAIAPSDGAINSTATFFYLGGFDGGNQRKVALAHVPAATSFARGDLLFCNNNIADGTDATTANEIARITNTGYLRMAASTGGIQFNGDTAAVNALNDYEEGTFVPAIAGTTLPGTGTYAPQQGRYIKIGRLVHVQMRLTWSAHTGTGNMKITGLPFTVLSGGSVEVPISLRISNLTSPANTTVQGYCNVNTTEIILESVLISGAASSPLALDTAADIMITTTYTVA